MKKLFIYGSVALMTLTGCNDLLDKSPLDKFTNTPEYWSNTNNLDNQCNTFYNNYSGYGNGGGGGWFYFKTLSDDQVGYQSNEWTYTNVGSTDTNWSGPFTEIRRANYILEGLTTSTLDEATRANYEGIARLNRAWEYYQLVRMYGDVQWITTVINPDDAPDVVYGSRTDRDEVMDKVLEDLTFATKNITGTNKQRFNADMAYAMLADVALYEGTYCKYRTQAENGKAPDETRAQKYLNECVKACEVLMEKGYQLNDSYIGNYNSIDLNNNPEVIFFKPYSQNVLMHSTIDYTVNTSGTSGMTKDAFDSYLFLDGKPVATTTMDKSDAAEKVVTGQDENGQNIYSYSITKALSTRDKRLTETIDPVLCFKGSPYSRAGVAQFTSSTGYGVAKYDNTTDLSVSDRNNINKQYTDCPLYWLSVVYLNYAEAKAELGSITKTDLEKSVDLLLARAGLPAMELTPVADPANDMNVSNLIWEIRRCRRCELMFDNWTRYWDLIRWHQLEKLDNSKNPDIYLGANVSMVTDPEIDVNANGYMVGANTINQPRTFDAKHYFYPIPTSQLTLNTNIKQNPGWEK